VKGRIMSGMTKADVLLARGYPPFQRTASIESLNVLRVADGCRRG